MRITSVLTFAAAVLCASTATADQMCAGGRMAEVRSAPGGSQTASIFPYSCVTTGEKRDIWVKVTIEGWVDEAELTKKASAAASSGSAPAALPADPLQLADFDVAVGNRDLQGIPSRVQLTLKVKNVTSNPISGWSGLVAAQDAKSRVLFRYRVSDESTIAPGATKDVSYYWEKGEEPFEPLSSMTKESLRISLHKVELRR